jgi:hypothetical protein
MFRILAIVITGVLTVLLATTILAVHEVSNYEIPSSVDLRKG